MENSKKPEARSSVFPLILCFLPAPPHPLPGDKAVEIPRQKGAEADDHRYVPALFRCRKAPKEDQHHVVGGIGKGEIGAAKVGEVHRREAGGPRNQELPKITVCILFRGSPTDCPEFRTDYAPSSPSH